MKIILIVAASLGLTACSMAPAYEEPDMPVPENYQSDGENTSQILSDWESFVADPQLRELLVTALDNNRDLRIATLNAEQLRAMYRIERAQQIPQLGISGEGRHQHLPSSMSTGFVGTTRQYNVSLGVSAYELDFFGRLDSLSDAAIQRYIASEAAQKTVQISLISELAARYIAWQIAAAEHDVLSQGTEDRLQAYQLMEKRVEQGINARRELLSIQAELQSAHIALSQKQQAMNEHMNAIRELAGQQVSLQAVPLDEQLMVQEVPAGLPADLLQQRPDILEAEAMLRAANADIGAARANFFPRISLTAQAGTASSSLSDLFSSDSGSWRFVPQLYLPVFHAGANKARLEQAHLAQQMAVADYERRVQTAFREVSDSLQGRVELKKQMRAMQRQLDNARELYRMTLQRYEQGMDDYLTVLQVRRDYQQYQVQALAMQQQVINNRLTLFRALGGGWQSSRQGLALHQH